MIRDYLLVDGYNIIFADDELAELASDSLDFSRRKLCDMLVEYAGLTDGRIIAVFDAHLVEKGTGSVEEYHNIMIVFTREAETADRYIERTAQRLARRDSVTVATSDRLEQLIIIGQGACRISARELLQSIERAKKALRERYARTRPLKRNPIEQLLDPDTAKKLDEMRYNRK